MTHSTGSQVHPDKFLSALMFPKGTPEVFFLLHARCKRYMFSFQRKEYKFFPRISQSKIINPNCCVAFFKRHSNIWPISYNNIQYTLYTLMGETFTGETFSHFMRFTFRNCHLWQNFAWFIFTNGDFEKLLWHFCFANCLKFSENVLNHKSFYSL